MIDNINPALTWFLAGLVMLLGELLLPGFVVLFFGLGAWVTAICIWLGVIVSFESQLFVFLGSSIILLILFRKKGSKYFRGKVSGQLGDGQSIDDVRGQRGVVLADIHPISGGKVEFNGSPWMAAADVPIGKGTTVEIVERKNLTLHVKPIE